MKEKKGMFTDLIDSVKEEKLYQLPKGQMRRLEVASQSIEKRLQEVSSILENDAIAGEARNALSKITFNMGDVMEGHFKLTEKMKSMHAKDEDIAKAQSQYVLNQIDAIDKFLKSDQFRDMIKAVKDHANNPDVQAKAEDMHKKRALLDDAIADKPKLKDMKQELAELKGSFKYKFAALFGKEIKAAKALEQKIESTKKHFSDTQKAYEEASDKLNNMQIYLVKGVIEKVEKSLAKVMSNELNKAMPHPHADKELQNKASQKGKAHTH